MCWERRRGAEIVLKQSNTIAINRCIDDCEKKSMPGDRDENCTQILELHHLKTPVSGCAPPWATKHLVPETNWGSRLAIQVGSSGDGEKYRWLVVCFITATFAIECCRYLEGKEKSLICTCVRESRDWQQFNKILHIQLLLSSVHYASSQSVSFFYLCSGILPYRQ